MLEAITAIGVTITFTVMTAVAIWKNWEFTALAFGIAAMVVGCEAVGMN